MGAFWIFDQLDGFGQSCWRSSIVAQALFRDFSNSFSVNLTLSISCLNLHVSWAICEWRLEKMSSIRDSKAFNLSRIIFTEASVRVGFLVIFHFSAVVSTSCRRRFGGRARAWWSFRALWNENRWQTSNVSGEKVQWCYMVLRRHHQLKFEGSKMARRSFSQLGNRTVRIPRPTAMETGCPLSKQKDRKRRCERMIQ